MIRRLWSEQVRITFWAWIATIGGAIMLAPLTESKRYLVIGAFGVAVVAVVGAALRARRIHPIFVLAAELVVAFEWAILMFARDNAVLGLFPGPDAVSDLSDRWSAYADTANRFAAPLPHNDDVTMAMTLVMVGLGVIVDVVAVSWRRASLLGLVFLAVYMTPVSILGGEISILAFLCGALGYVFLLAADERERLTHWGRQISTASSLWDRPSEVDEGGLRRNGTRVGLSAIALAAVVPILVPTLSPHYFGQSGSGGPGGSDGGSVTIEEPILDLRRNLDERTDKVLLRVSTTDPLPDYFRLAAMDHFTGNSWQITTRESENAVPASETLPPAPGLSNSVISRLYEYEVEATEDFDSTWLPLVYAPVSIDAQSDWLLDRTHLDAYIDGAEDTTAGISYRFSASKTDPSAIDMRGGGRPPADLEEFLELPDDLPEEFREVARRETSGERTKFDKARELESYFNSGDEFTYSLEHEEITANGIDDLVDFLTEDQVGYCEQFASAMAIMARTLGIPSRVAVGFLQPSHLGGNEWEYRGTDMHAWPELYFNDAGWTRFEPTPDTDDSDGAQPLPFINPLPGNTTDTFTAPTNTRPTNDPRGPSSPTTGSEDSDDEAGSGGGVGRWWPAAVVLVGVGLIAATPRLVRASVRRRRWSRATGPVDTAEAAWAELRDHVVDLRMEWDPGETPRATGRTLRERLPDDRQAGGPVVAGLNRLVLAIEQARYARGIRQPEGLRDAVETVADALSSRQTSRQRFLARWLPISLLRTRGRRARVGTDRLGELLVSVEE
jgi:transglutaminase-like putative cysteine protease